jgi:hypothetical protein
MFQQTLLNFQLVLLKANQVSEKSFSQLGSLTIFNGYQTSVKILSVPHGPQSDLTNSLSHKP